MVLQIISIKEYFLPKSAAEASRLLKKGEKRYYPIAGGTSFAFGKPSGIEGLVDLSRIGLHYVKFQEDGIHIGAGTPIRDLVKFRLFSEYMGGIVSEAGKAIATTPLRNLITAGGNVMKIFPWSNLPPLFLALDAVFKTTGSARRTINAKQFFSVQPRRQLAPGEILKEIVIPAPQKGRAGAYMKFSKTETDFGLLNAAAVIKVEKGICSQARIALGAFSPMPLLLTRAEEILKNKPATKENMEQAAQALCETIEPSNDFRVRQGYKKEIAHVLVNRCLCLAMERAKASGR